MQNLQTKLSATTPAPSQTAVPTPTSTQYTTRASPSATIPPVPPMPSLTLTHTPTFAKPGSSMASITRSKTPEAKRTQLPVFKKTPEATRTPSALILSDESTPSSGKKRSAPDDFDPSEPLPPQPIVAEGSTPRSRRAIPTVSRFTPVRSHAGSVQPTLSQPSPLRRRTTYADQPVIADVTNSPRRVFTAHNKPQSRGWLGKIRGGPSESSARTTTRLIGSDEARAYGGQ